MNAESCDANILGCRPGGGSAVMFRTRASNRRLGLEQETFPRVHTGESWWPCNLTIFRKNGALPATAPTKS